jgi:putative phosphoribosyl transferase
MKPNELTTETTIPIDGVSLGGSFELPATRPAAGLVIFAHGSGSSRFSSRNRYVAEALRDDGFATLLFDLLTERESEDRRNVFDIPLLADRLAGATRWARAQPLAPGSAGGSPASASDDSFVKIGYFGASTGAGAALIAAADDPSIAAVVSRGGRPDLALEHLPRVTAPTLLIVGGEDTPVIEMNRTAQAAMTCECELVIVPGATHLFEEPGTLEKVARLASQWFARHLTRTA